MEGNKSYYWIYGIVNFVVESPVLFEPVIYSDIKTIGIWDKVIILMLLLNLSSISLLFQISTVYEDSFLAYGAV